MKACPTCKRTYSDDTLSFCLVDGAILSAPYEPHETARIPAARSTDPAATEILNATAGQPDPTPPLLSTIQSPQPPPLYSEKFQPQSKEKRSALPWVAIGVVVSLAGIVVVGAVVLMIWFGKDSAADNRPNSNIASPSPTPTATPTPIPTPTPVGGWSPKENASINQGDGTLLTYYGGSTPDRCQDDCEANARCKAYTFIRAGAYNANDPPMCYLLSEVRKLTPSDCCISAVKR